MQMRAEDSDHPDFDQFETDQDRDGQENNTEEIVVPDFLLKGARFWSAIRTLGDTDPKTNIDQGAEQDTPGDNDVPYFLREEYTDLLEEEEEEFEDKRDFESDLTKRPLWKKLFSPLIKLLIK